MKNIALLIPALLFTALALTACQKQAPEKEARAKDSAPIPGIESLISGTATPPVTAAGKVYGTVNETFDTGGYTYLQVDTGEEKVWAAGPPTPLKKGDMVSFTTEMPMENFHSKTLNRDFAVLYFVSKINTGAAMGASHPEAATLMPHANITNKEPAPATRTIAKVENGYTIDEIYQQKSDLAGKRVRVRGEVTKVTTNVQDKNWIHIKDGSRPEDLTITTTDDVKPGNIIVVDGKVIADRETGFGRIYAVILEDGKLSIEK